MGDVDNIKKLKEEYVNYFKDVPVQKYAAMSISRDEDTIIRWKKEDSDFADAILRSKADWVRKRLLATKAEFALERLTADLFKEVDDSSVEHLNVLRDIADSLNRAWKDMPPNDPHATHPPHSAS